MLKTLLVVIVTGIVLILGGSLVGQSSFSGKTYFRIVLFLLAAPFALVSCYLSFYLLLPHPAAIKTELYDEVSYSRSLWQKGDQQAVVHIVKAAARNIDLEISMGGGAKTDIPAMTSSDALKFYKADLALNGSFFTPFRDKHLLDYYPHSGDPVTPVGQVVSRGILHGMYEQNWPKFVWELNGKARITSEIFDEQRVSSEKIISLISGRSILLENGKILVEGDSKPYPRTVLGLSENAKYVWFVVVDGKQPGYSDGMPLRDMAEYLLELGVENAIELDGGGSSTMVRARRGKDVIRLSRPSHTKVPNRERPVANHVLVRFKGVDS